MLFPKAKKCPALRKLSFGTVEPVDCVTRAQNYAAGCIFRCNNGYTMQGNGNLVCREDGTWSRDIPTCEGDHKLFFIPHHNSNPYPNSNPNCNSSLNSCDITVR